MTTPLGPGAEFDVVRRLLAGWGDAATGIGDDAAVLEVPNGERLVASTDTSVEDVHFRREWLSPEEIGWRATTAALSDLAAMGARPLGVLLALTLPSAWRDALDAIATGVGGAVSSAGTHIVGGDLTSGDALSLGVTVLGSTSRPVSRSGACVGDVVYVTGRLGASRAALTRLLAGDTPRPGHRARFARPVARIAAGQLAARLGATAMIDVSDGLVADLRHVAAASSVTLQLDAAQIPIAAGASLDDALGSGEEYELAFTMPSAVDVVAAFASQRDALLVTAIGVVQSLPDDAAERVVVRGLDRVDLPSGHDHFSR